MITLDWLHLTLGSMFLFTLFWYIVSTAGAQTIVNQLKTENRMLVALFKSVEKPVPSQKEDTVE